MKQHRIARLALIAALASAALVSGCATGPYYDDYGYGSSYGYNPGPYYGPAYVAPSVGLGLSYSDRDYRDHRWRRDRDYRDRDGRDWRDRTDRVERPAEWRDHNGELRDREGRTAADRDRAANSASGG